MTTKLRWVPTKRYSEHLYGFHGGYLVAQVLHTDRADGRHWRAFLAHRPVDDHRWDTAEEAIEAAEVAWRLARSSRPNPERRRRWHHWLAGRPVRRPLLPVG